MIQKVFRVGVPLMVLVSTAFAYVPGSSLKGWTYDINGQNELFLSTIGQVLYPLGYVAGPNEKITICGTLSKEGNVGNINFEISFHCYDKDKKVVTNNDFVKNIAKIDTPAVEFYKCYSGGCQQQWRKTMDDCGSAWCKHWGVKDSVDVKSYKVCVDTTVKDIYDIGYIRVKFVANAKNIGQKAEKWSDYVKISYKGSLGGWDIAIQIASIGALIAALALLAYALTK